MTTKDADAPNIWAELAETYSSIATGIKEELRTILDKNTKTQHIK